MNKLYFFAWIVLWVTLVPSSAQAQTAQLIQDINTTNAGSSPAGFIAIDSKVLFWADNGSLGREPHIYDPSTGITSLLMDIFPGSEASDASNNTARGVIQFQDHIYFIARHPAYGIELWRTDGTKTELVHDIAPGISDSSPDYLTIYNNSSDEKLYIVATASLEREIHIIDAKDGYEGVLNLNGSTSTDPQELTSFQNKIYFSADHPASGRELWSTDGTISNSKVVIDIISGSASSSPTKLFALDDNLLLFSAELKGEGRELCTYNGNILETEVLYTGSNSSNPDNFRRVNNQTYFTANDTNGDRRYYRLNGPNLPSIPMRILESYGFINKVEASIAYNGKLYYLYSNGLWELSATTDERIVNASRGEEIGMLNDKLFIIGRNPILTDGTLLGTTFLQEITNQSGLGGDTKNLAVINNVAYFCGNGPLGEEPYANSETSISNLIQNINEKSEDFNPSKIGIADDHIIFPVDDKSIWRSDGVTAQIILGQSDTSHRITSDVFRIDNELFFTAESADSIFSFFDANLMSYDILNRDFKIIENTESISIFDTNQERLQDFYFKDASNILRYSKYSQLETVYSSITDNFFVWNNDVFYVNSSTQSGLFNNDELILSISETRGKIRNFTPSDNFLFFTYTNSAFGNELWKTDGTAAGTNIASDINPSVGEGSNPRELVTINNDVFFIADDGTGEQVWKVEATSPNTEALTSGSISPKNLTPYNGDLYFSAIGQAGSSLWKSDGTIAGTHELKTINTAGNSDPKEFYVHNNILYFTANDGNTGQELWKTDGTSIGTVRVTDIQPGALGSSPSKLTSIKGKLIFIADHPTAGRELFSLDTCPNSLSLVCDNGPCEVNSTRLDSQGVIEVSNHKTLTDRALRIGASGGLTIDGELVVKENSLLELYSEGCY